MKLPIEAALLVLSFLRRHTLGRVLVANRRLSGIVNRHQKRLNLPEIPVPPRLSTRLKCLALLAIVMHLLLPIGIVFARRSTRSGLRATGFVPDSYRDVQHFLGVYHQRFACSTKCDAQLQCHSECGLQYTVQDESKGSITKRNCSIAGWPFTNASLATRIELKCSFDYAVKDDTDDNGESHLITFEWHWVTWTTLFLALFAWAVAVRLLRRDRKVADQYMAATSGPRRDRVLKKHRKLRKVAVNATVVCYALAGLYG
ncbi:hypothetical protein AAVH_33345, partial [Aphelenchoides avenae]